MSTSPLGAPCGICICRTGAVVQRSSSSGSSCKRRRAVFNARFPAMTRRAQALHCSEVEEPCVERSAHRADMVDAVGDGHATGDLAQRTERRPRELHSPEPEPARAVVAAGVAGPPGALAEVAPAGDQAGAARAAMEGQVHQCQPLLNRASPRSLSSSGDRPLERRSLCSWF